MKNALLISLLAFTTNVFAVTIQYADILAADAGRYGKATLNGNASCCQTDDNIGAGFKQVTTSPDDLSVKWRNWISFDLLAYTSETIVFASLEIFNHTDNDNSVSFTWRDVTEDATTGAPSLPLGTLIYDDLGAGAIYDSGTASGDGINDIYDFTNAFALTDINNASHMWTIGGSTLDDLGRAYDFSGGLIQLTLGYEVEEVAPVPIPSALWLFGSGLIALISITKRKNILKA